MLCNVAEGLGDILSLLWLTAVHLRIPERKKKKQILQGEARSIAREIISLLAI